MLMISDHDRFSKLCAGIQSIIVSIALVIGGGWTLYSFAASKTSEKAALDIDTAKKTAEKAALDIEIAKAKRPILDVSIDAKALTATDPSDKNAKEHSFIRVTVSLKNSGNTQIDIPLQKSRLSVAEVNIVDAGLVADETFTTTEHLAISPFSQASLVAGNTIQLSYLVNIKKPGLYFVEFAATLPKTAEVPPGGVAAPGSEFEHRYGITSTFIDVPKLTNRSR